MKRNPATAAFPGKIIVFGFGSQGRAQALNLRDSGLDVAVCLRPSSPRRQEVRDQGIQLIEDEALAARQADLAVVLIPDAAQPSYYNDMLARNLPQGAGLVFAHGFAVHYKQIIPRPDLDVLLAAPLAHGDAVRQGFTEHHAVPCITAVAQDATGRADEIALAYARAIAGKGPIIRSTFEEEVETDLFAEQAVLCGGVPELARAAFETMTRAGYSADISYFCCLRELRAIVDLMWRHSIVGMRERISDTAAYGAVTRGKRIAGDSMRQELEKMLLEIRSGAFAHELIEEQGKGLPKLKEALEQDRKHPIESIHNAHKVQF